eukprot:9655964-Lingulodinium_polyedra.AAC.1
MEVLAVGRLMVRGARADGFGLAGTEARTRVGHEHEWEAVSGMMLHAALQLHPEGLASRFVRRGGGGVEGHVDARGRRASDQDEDVARRGLKLAQ